MAVDVATGENSNAAFVVSPFANPDGKVVPLAFLAKHADFLGCVPLPVGMNQLDAEFGVDD